MLSEETRRQSALERISNLKNKLNSNHVLVHEIYVSIQGESTFVGVPCVFIRTTACHLRCSYCDTEHAFFGGKEWSVDDLAAKVNEYDIPFVEITGGEPLLQPSVLTLMTRLCDEGKTVLLETSGAVSIKGVDKRVHVILDVKTPGSKETSRNVWENLDALWPGCEVKFVICHREDYEFAKKVIFDYDLPAKANVLLSPESRTMDKQALASWIIEDRLPARFQIQLHKVVWGDVPGV